MAMHTVQELLPDVEERDGMRHQSYRWRIGDDEGTESTKTPLEPVAAEILADRWHGMMGRGNPTKMQQRLDGLLWDIAERLTRRDLGSDHVVIDGRPVGVDYVMEIDELEHVIRDWMLERATKVAEA